MKPNIGIEEDGRRAVAKGLCVLLADEYVLYTKTRNCHWNVVGPNFSELHKFFEAQYEALDDSIDEIAERIRALGEPSPGSLAEFLKDARLEETAGKPAKGAEMLPGLVEDHEAVIRTLRSDVGAAAEHGDEGTADFLTGLLEKHEKTAWMLRSHAA